MHNGVNTIFLISHSYSRYGALQSFGIHKFSGLFEPFKIFKTVPRYPNIGSQIRFALNLTQI